MRKRFHVFRISIALAVGAAAMSGIAMSEGSAVMAEKTSSGFYTEDGKTYYRDEEGNLVTDSMIEVDGNAYYLDPEGVLLVSGNVVLGDLGFRADKNGVLSVKGGWMKVGENWYYTETDGKLRRSWVVRTGGITYYVNADGIMVTDEIVEVEGKYYYFDSTGALVLSEGWFQLDDNWYYLKGDWSLAWDEVIEVNNRKYFMDEDGCLVTNAVVEIDGQLYYALSSGAIRTFGGWVYAGNDWYYAGNDGVLVQNQVITSAGRLYALNQEGKLCVSQFVYTGDKLYFATSSGAFYKGTGWRYDDGGWHFAEAGGEFKLDGFITSAGKQYYMNSEGIMVTDSIVSVGEDSFYVNQNGVLRTASGWIYHDSCFYYIDSSGKILKDSILGSGEYMYYMDPEGRMVTSCYAIASNGKTYQANEKGELTPVTGWLDNGGQWLYADENGIASRDEFTVLGGKTYYFDKDGVMASDGFFFVGNDMYYAAKSGNVRTTRGWMQLGENWYFSNDKGVFFRSATITSKGEEYYFNAEGIWEPVDEYYYTGIIEDTSYISEGERRYHVDSNGEKDSWFGIDVSAWNGDIDWKKVAADGVDFAIIRAGGRFAESGGLYDDSKLVENIKGATEAGIPVGVYFFTQAISVEEAIEEAEYTVSRIKGLDVELPVVIDTEYKQGGRHNDISRQTRTDVVKAFCDTVEKAGYKSMYYAGMAWCESDLDTTQLTEYMHWCAQWWIRNQCDDLGIPYQVWQYSETGSIDGIKGNVDINIWYKNK